MALQYDTIVQAQTGKTRDDIAAEAQRLVPLPPLPKPTQATPSFAAPEVTMPSTITSDVLGTTTKATVPTAPPSSPPPVPNVADEIIKSTQVEDTAAQKQAANLSQSIIDLLPKLQGETAALADEQNKAGVSNLKSDLNALNAQILQKQAEIGQSDTQLVAQSRAEETRDTLLPFAQNAQAKLAGDAAILRALKTSEIGVLNARAIAKQGDIALAMETAKQAVDVKYAPYKEAISLYKAQLEALTPILSKDEKKQANEQKLRTDLALQEISRRQQQEDKVNEVMVQAAKFGADQGTLTKIQGAKSVADAIKNSGNFLSAEFRNTLEQQAFDNKVKLQQVAISRANLAISQAELGLKRQELEQKQKEAKDALQATPELMAYAQQYASTGQIPTNIPKGSFGVLADIAKSLPKENGYLVDKNTGIKSNGVSDTRQESIVSLYDIVAKKLPILEEKFKSIDTGPIGRIGAAFYTTQDRQDFRTARQEILNLLIKARSGAAVSEPEYNRYLKLVPGELSITGLNQIKSLGTQLKNTLDSQLQGSGLSIYGYSKVNLDGNTYTAGDILDNGKIKARVNPDGTLSLVQ